MRSCRSRKGTRRTLRGGASGLSSCQQICILAPMSFNEHVYDVGIHLARPLVQLGTPFSQKLRAGLAGRRGARDRLIGWANAHRDQARPLVWVHAPSVGESLMAQAIITELRNARPNVQIAFTHFSPSALRVADRVGADVFDYMPWDS